jgi:hypothetical protein
MWRRRRAFTVSATVSCCKSSWAMVFFAQHWAVRAILDSAPPGRDGRTCLKAFFDVERTAACARYVHGDAGRRRRSEGVARAAGRA